MNSPFAIILFLTFITEFALINLFFISKILDIILSVCLPFISEKKVFLELNIKISNSLYFLSKYFIVLVNL